MKFKLSRQSKRDIVAIAGSLLFEAGCIPIAYYWMWGQATGIAFGAFMGLVPFGLFLWAGRKSKQ